MMNTEVGSGSSFLAFAPLLWGPYLFSSLLARKIFLGSDPRPTPSRLNSIRRLLRVYLGHGGFSHLIANVWKTCGEVAERRSEIRESWVVLTVED